MKLLTVPKIKSAMTPFPYSIALDQSIESAESMMSVHGIRHLPVTQAGRLIGVLSERDIKRAAAALADETRARELRVGDVCELEAYVVDLNETLDDVLAEMASRHSDCALVVRGGKLAGIFTTSDACRGYAEMLRSTFPRGGDDDAA